MINDFNEKTDFENKRYNSKNNVLTTELQKKLNVREGITDGA